MGLGETIEVLNLLAPIAGSIPIVGPYVQSMLEVAVQIDVDQDAVNIVGYS